MRSFLIAILAAGTTGLLAQQAPLFRSGVDAVLVDLRVVDDQGRFIPNLERSDFTITEDGQPQSVSSVELVDLPLVERSPSGADLIDADVGSNQQPEGRFYLLVLDDVHSNRLSTAIGSRQQPTAGARLPSGRRYR